MDKSQMCECGHTARWHRFVSGSGCRHIDKKGTECSCIKFIQARKIVGIDLAGVTTKPTGFASLFGLRATTKILFSDNEIIEEIAWSRSAILSIDAPLSKPLSGKSRQCEKDLRKMKIRVFPCMFAGMKKLTERGIMLATTFREHGYRVIESYPGAAQDILKIPRKKQSLQPLINGLRDHGITGIKRDVTDHELDAITSAIVGKMYLLGTADAIGDINEGQIIVPRIRPNLLSWSDKK